MQPTQRKYLTERLVKIAKHKIEVLNNLIVAEAKEHNKINRLTKNDLMQYLSTNYTLKGDPQDYIPTYTNDLFNLSEVYEFVGKQPLIETGDNCRIELNGSYIYVSQTAFDLANKIRQKMISTIDEIMLGDSTKAVELMTKFEDFTV